MKIILLYATVFCFFISCNESKQRNTSDGELKSPRNILSKNFEYHFHIFDSTSESYPLDSIYPGQPYSIKFMEENTGISSESDMTLLGKIFFSKKDLQKWHEWYEKKYGERSN